MKKIVVTLLLFIGLIGYSQTNGITYQAVILNPSGEQLPGVNNTNAPLANKYICLKFSIIDQNSQSEYIETVQTTTDEFGMVNLVIGTGVQIGGYATSFSNILWNANPKNLKVDLSTTGICSYYTEISNQPFTAVPFALFALNTESTAALTALQATVTSNAIATTAALALKEDAINKSSTTTLGTSNVLFPTQNAVKTYVDTNISTVNANNTALQAIVAANATAANNAIATVQADVNQNEADGDAADVILQNNITSLQTTVASNATATTSALGLKEDAINKSSTTTLGTSNVLFPTQNAVKTYVDTNITTVNSNNTALQVTVAANATAATNAIAAVQADVNQNETDGDAADVILQNNITTLQNTVTSNATATTAALVLKENAANKSTTTTLGSSDILFPTQNAVKMYVDGSISTSNITNAAVIAAVQADVDANEIAATNAITALGNTVTSNTTATTAALALKEDAINKSTDVTLSDTTNTKFPTELAVKTYVANQVSSGTATNVSGIVGIANGGTGSATQNFVDLTTTQNIAGVKNFSNNITANQVSIGSPNTGSQNTMLGAVSFGYASPGNNNTALGFFTLASLNGGNDNTAVGTNAIRQGGAANGNRNTAVGSAALSNGSGPDDNTAIGYATLAAGISGSSNTAVGSYTFQTNTTGSNNVGIGKNAGITNTTGNNNTLIGTEANVGTNNLSNATALGYGAVATANNTIQLGNASVTNVNTKGSITANAEISSEITANLTINNTNAEQYKAKVLICNPSSPITITFSNDLPLGFNCMVLQKSIDANKIILAGGTGVTLKNRSNYTATAGNYAIATIVNIGGGIIVTAGDMQ